MDKTKIWLSAPHLGGTEQKYVNEALETNWVAPLGPNVDGFEKDIAKFIGMEQVAALSSGTAALHLTMDLFDVQPGDYVLVQSFTFCGSTNPIAYKGATPIFIDSELDSWNMSPEHLRNAIDGISKKGEQSKIKMILPVHLYGMPARIDDILRIGEEYGIPVVEDAAESLGSTLNGQHTGTFGESGIFSFNGNKIITTSGGGALTARDTNKVERTRYLSTQARQNAPHYEHTDIGYNYRMSNIVAGIGRGQMEVLSTRVEQRRKVFNQYVEHLGAWNAKGFDIVFQPEREGAFSNRWLTAVLIDPNKNRGMTREDVRLALEKENIESRPLWKPMHMQPVYEGSTFYGDGVCETLFEHGLCLPSCSSMTDEEWSRIARTLDDVLSKFS